MTREKVFKYLFIIIIIFTPVGSNAQDSVDDMLKAIKFNDMATVRNGLARGFDVDTAAPGGNTLLMLAAAEGHFEMTRMLLNAKARVHARNAYGDSPLMFAALKGHLEIVRLLLGYGADAGGGPGGWTPLHYCASEGHTATCQELLERGALVDATSANGTTPLMMAARGGHLDVVRQLLARKAAFGAKNQNGLTATAWALRGKHTDIVDALREAGAKE